ncbi:MAG: FtsH protease activity modulator HflK [Chitinispirillaceae bacterium]
MLEKLKSYFNKKRSFSIFILLIIGIAGWVFFTGLYTVAVDEIAVIQRFGKYNRQAGPGLRFKLPDGIEKRTNIRVQKINTQEFGFRTIKAGVKSDYERGAKYKDESLMLTGDLNCAIVEWLVQYRISEPVAYLFAVRDVEGTLRDISEATMREIIGDRSINEVITNRLEIADEAKLKLQTSLEKANTGLTVVNLELKNTNVPQSVEPSFNEVNQAQQEKERMIYEAREDYNKAIPAARGEAQRVVRAAEGYALDRINTAHGDSARYVSLYEAYRHSKDVTRRRLYLEAMREIMPRMGKKFIMEDGQKGILPLLNLNKGGSQ